jgi:hypothetical protein
MSESEIFSCEVKNFSKKSYTIIKVRYSNVMASHLSFHLLLSVTRRLHFGDLSLDVTSSHYMAPYVASTWLPRGFHVAAHMAYYVYVFQVVDHVL